MSDTPVRHFMFFAPTPLGQREGDLDATYREGRVILCNAQPTEIHDPTVTVSPSKVTCPECLKLLPAHTYTTLSVIPGGDPSMEPGVADPSMEPVFAARCKRNWLLHYGSYVEAVAHRNALDTVISSLEVFENVSRRSAKLRECLPAIKTAETVSGLKAAIEDVANTVRSLRRTAEKLDYEQAMTLRDVAIYTLVSVFTNPALPILRMEGFEVDSDDMEMLLGFIREATVSLRMVFGHNGPATGGDYFVNLKVLDSLGLPEWLRGAYVARNTKVYKELATTLDAIIYAVNQ